MKCKIINKTLLLAIGLSAFFVVITYLNSNYYYLKNIFLLKDFVEMMQKPALIMSIIMAIVLHKNAHQQSDLIFIITLFITYLLFFYCLIFVIKAIKQEMGKKSKDK